MSGAQEIILYSYRRCPFAMRVRLTLHEKQIPFRTIEEDLSNFSPTLKSLHPEAKVPVLVQGLTVVYESAVITEYLEDKYPEPPLLPKDASLRAEVRLWTYWCNHSFKLDLDRFKYRTSRFTESECVGVEERVENHLKKVESRLVNHTWLVADNLSLADVHVFPFIRQLSRVKEAQHFFTKLPGTSTWVERISSRPAFLKTMEKA